MTTTTTDTTPRSTTRVRGGAWALAIGGVSFALYDLVRPAGDDLRAMASESWVLAHLAAMAGFALLPLGLGALWLVMPPGRAERRAIAATVVTAVGVAATLPYYGAEDFGLHAIATAPSSSPTALAALPDLVRFSSAPAVTFVLGLALLAVGLVVAALAVSASTTGVARWAGAPLALAMVLFVPQFFAPAPVRVAHGALLALGCVAVAVLVHRRASEDPGTMSDRLSRPGPARS